VLKVSNDQGVGALEVGVRDRENERTG